MKLAVAGKGGVGKTTLTAWLGDYLARQGREVWLVDADTALSLGGALGIPPEALPVPLVRDEALLRERVGDNGFINLNPAVEDLPDRLRVRAGNLSLLVMGTVAGAGGGCACQANSLLKALLAHLVVEREQWLLVDLEAGVEHLGRGTVAAADGLIVVSEPSHRGLTTAARIATLAADLGLTRQVLVLNRSRDDRTGQAGQPGQAGQISQIGQSRQLDQIGQFAKSGQTGKPGNNTPSGQSGPDGQSGQSGTSRPGLRDGLGLPAWPDLPDIPGLPPLAAVIPSLPSLEQRQLGSPSVLDLPEREILDGICAAILAALVHGADGPNGAGGANGPG